jgi:hypothetical protein
MNICDKCGSAAMNDDPRKTLCDLCWRDAEIKRLNTIIQGARAERQDYSADYGWNNGRSEYGFYVRKLGDGGSVWAGKTIEEAWIKIGELASRGEAIYRRQP